MKITDPSRPIIVCGYARSGTSLIGQLLRSSGQAVMFPEMNIHSTESMFNLLGEVRATIRAQRWRGFSEADIEARVVELLRRIWGAGRDPDLHDDTGQPRFGLKQPHAEEFAERFREVLGEWRPQWVYTVREPAAIYHSNLRMPAFGDVPPDQFLRRLIESLGHIQRLMNEGDGFVVWTDRTGQDAGYRTEVVDRMVTFLGMERRASIDRFVEKWPEINVSEGDNRGPLPDDEIERRVAALSQEEDYAVLMRELDRLR